MGTIVEDACTDSSYLSQPSLQVPSVFQCYTQKKAGKIYQVRDVYVTGLQKQLGATLWRALTMTQQFFMVIMEL